MARASALIVGAVLVGALIACEGKETPPVAPAPVKREVAPAKAEESKPAVAATPEGAAPKSVPGAPKAPDVGGATVKGPDGKDYAVLSTSKTPGGVIVEEITTGTGAEATIESTLTFHYEGTLANGKIFDGSIKRGQPVVYPMRRLVKGWQEAIPGMRVGGVRRLTVPPALAYPQGTPDGAVPPNTTTYFWIKLVDVK